MSPELRDAMLAPVVWVDVMAPSGHVVRMSLRQYVEGGYARKGLPWVICGDPIDGWWPN